MAEGQQRHFQDTAITVEDVAQAVVDMNEYIVVDLVKGLLAQGASPLDILVQGLMHGIASIAEKFKRGEAYVTEVLLSAQVMERGTAILAPLLKDNGQKIGVVVLGTVEGDLHDIGKKMVGVVLQNAGFQVIDLGVDVPPSAFAQAIREHQPHILGLSALLTTTVGQISKTIQHLEQAGLRKQVKIIVGGVPITAEYAQNAGADGYADDFFGAVDWCQAVMQAL